MRPKSKFRYVNHDLWAVMERARKQVPMSALGQKRLSECPLYPQKQTLVESPNIATAQRRAGSGIAAAIRPADGFGTLRISIAATTHSAPAAKNAGK